MSANKMLIDATHPEETRVVVLKQGRVEEFDYESASRKILRGNIYLAKVTRVEPSLQAAFVDYGGNRHGFLAFSEIHPDYYQIPMADRQALLEEEAMAEAEQAAADDAEAEDFNADDDFNGDEDDDQPEENSLSSNDDDANGGSDQDTSETEAVARDAADDVHEVPENGEPRGEPDPPVSIDLAQDGGEAITEPMSDSDSGAEGGRDTEESSAAQDGAEAQEQPDVEPADTDAVNDAGDDALEEMQSRPRRRPRSYKIQEVIKRRQVILIQVVKEERGNKGAALTTYLSLAGRYTVLMPNTARGGGISRKISNPQDRKRLKTIANELDVPEGMGLIVRTAGASRTKQELRRDFEYLLRLWESVRDLTLQSSAPSLVYEEGNLIKRSIRDLYSKEIDEVVVAGSGAYKQAKEFMRMLMPSHAKNVTQHNESESLFNVFGIERQLNAMFSPQVTLRSGGYLIINQTEALVAIDVNSGKATREFSIEETALATNLEAATEISRQLKLRDLAGLIVIDFIDMDERRNNRAVERRLKEALRQDRARIQFGRISHFGLMEMSRQRLRTGVLEGSTTQCPHCQGTGTIRSTDSVALAVLRAIEDTVSTGEPRSIVATTSSEAAIYILNHKRGFLNEIEQRHGISVSVEASDKMQGANFAVGKLSETGTSSGGDRTVVNVDWGYDAGADEADGEGRGTRRRGRGEDDSGDGQRSGRRRRRRRGRRSGRSQDAGADDIQSAASSAGEDGAPEDSQDQSTGDRDQGEAEAAEATSESGGRRTRRRRGRRGGSRERRGRNRRDQTSDGAEGNGQAAHAADGGTPDGAQTQEPDAPLREHDSNVPQDHVQPEDAPVAKADDVSNSGVSAQPEAQSEAEVAPQRPRRSSTSSAPKLERVLVTPDNAGAAPEEEATEPDSGRRGWWQRRIGRE